MSVRIGYWRFIAVAAVSAVLLSCCGCGGENPVQIETEPEGKLRLEVNSDYVKVGETLTFTVFKGTTDVTAQAEIRRRGDPDPYEKSIEADKAGIRYFYARYNGTTTSFVPVKFYAGWGEDREFFKRSLVFKFTATWCGACPLMSSYLAEIEKEQPGRIAVMAVHSGDTFSTRECGELVSDFAIDSYPRAVFDYKTCVSNSAAALSEALSDILAEEPAVCGISLDSSVTGDQAVVRVKVRIAENGRYRICCAVVEDGLRYEGGSSDDGYGNYNRVLRRFVTDRIGVDVGSCDAGDDFEREYTFDVPEEWGKANCTVLVTAMRMQEDGQTVYANNTASCALDGGHCDFEYEPEVNPM